MMLLHDYSKEFEAKESFLGIHLLTMTVLLPVLTPVLKVKATQPLEASSENKSESQPKQLIARSL